MARISWHTQRSDKRFVLARHLPPRFDIMAVAHFPPVQRGRLARQIRQDMWRMLRHVRGFSPVVQIDTVPGGLRVTAGGQASYPVAPNASEKVYNLLNSAAHRKRWMQWADVRAQSC